MLLMSQHDSAACQHLPLRDGLDMINNIKKSGAKYLVVTNHDPSIWNGELNAYGELNPNVGAGQMYWNNMLLPPFNFGPPLADVADNLDTDDDKRAFGNLVIYDLQQMSSTSRPQDVEDVTTKHQTHLRSEMEPGFSGTADALPPGDYRDSCKECVLKNSTMHCLCIEEKDKDPQPSQLPNADKCEDVKNAEGMLTCYKILKQREVPSASNRTIPQIVHYGSSWRAWTVMRRNMPFLPEFRVRHYNGLTPSFNITLTVIWLHQKSRWSRQPMISPQNSSKGEW